MAQPNRDPAGSSDIIDDALRLVDALQRKLIIAGVRRGVSGATSQPQRKGDVWEEAVKEAPGREEPALDQMIGIVRTAGPQVAEHIGRAGSVLFGALGEAWGVVERSRRQAEQQRRDGGSDGPPPAIPRAD
ncbi:hypothetical protein HDA32_003849 [Spinactinospora alkalitolerans]|uniref:Uncharacterized protein n=1 Tax=Spinactinospora alkalitolerans TaxID=687207 RepID=A0A852TXK0_9ACTN|nr:hypothetical protein [Spinactinospora alkalitolerans]NYE48729.1 hypothetical protein [Spinactinospora alkalitolerans]